MLSSFHYDSVCRQASHVGGFLYGWVNSLDLGTSEVLANPHQIGMCLKILEIGNSGVVSAIEIPIASKLRLGLGVALKSCSDEWQRLNENNE